MKLCLLIAIIGVSANGAMRYVSPSGADTGNADSWASPWQTLAYAVTHANNGDTINIGQGTYAEHVSVQTITNITFQGYSNATVRSFYVYSPSNTISGLRLSSQNEYMTTARYAHIVLTPTAHFSTVTNCIIGNVPSVSGTNFFFDDAAQTITCTNVDFVAAGIHEGAVLHINGSSRLYDQFSNLGRAAMVTNIATHTLSVSNAIVAETNNNVWAILYPRGVFAAHFGIDGIVGSVSGGLAATNVTVINNLFTNYIGNVCIILGHQWRFQGNEIVNIPGNSSLVFPGSNHLIVSNYFHDCDRPIYYSAWEGSTSPYTNHVVHTGREYDFIHAYLQQGVYTLSDNTNILIAWNWFENVEQPVGNWGLGSDPNSASAHHVYWRSNVFVGMARAMDGGCNDSYVENNTFYKCAWEEESVAAMNVGGSGSTNFTVRSNLFVACGDHALPGGEGHYGLANVYGIITTNFNLICGPEVTGWTNNYWVSEANGLEQNPKFVNAPNPRGPDGIPFTADDGLRLRADTPSPGWGALGVASLSECVPVLEIAACNSNVAWQGWTEPTRSNYNVAWQLQQPWERQGPYINYAYDPIPSIPNLCTFTATNSISGTWSTNDWVGIRDFVWDFGDGSRPVWTRWPDVSHTFLINGEITLTLTVTNSAGTVASTSKKYRVQPVTDYAGDIYYVATNGSDAAAGTYAAPVLTITNAARLAVPGDYICVLPGVYTNGITKIGYDYGVHGTAANPINLIGYSAKIGSVYAYLSHWHYEGFEIAGDGVDPALAMLWWYPFPRTNLVFRNFYMHNGPWQVDAFDLSAESGVGSKDVLFQNNQFYEIAGLAGNWYITGRDVVIDANVLTWSKSQSDIRIDGTNVVISRNYYLAHGYTNGNHADFIVYLNPAGSPTVGNYLIERNWFEMPADRTNATQIANIGTGDGSYVPGNTNFIWRNNVFMYVLNGANPLTGDGSKFYNNLFYRSGVQGGPVLLLSSSTGSMIDTDIKNNVFYQCGTTTNNGWYDNCTLVRHTNITLTADYNFVTHSGNIPKQNWSEGRPIDQFWSLWGIPEVAANAVAAGVPIQTQAALEAHGINGGDPKFLNEAIQDFRPAPDSPLLTNGVAIGAVTIDFWGRTRPATPSIGPFESGVSLSSPSANITLGIATMGKSSL